MAAAQRFDVPGRFNLYIAASAQAQVPGQTHKLLPFPTAKVADLAFLFAPTQARHPPIDIKDRNQSPLAVGGGRWCVYPPGPRGTKVETAAIAGDQFVSRLVVIANQVLTPVAMAVVQQHVFVAYGPKIRTGPVVAVGAK